jgi:aspartyl-tRNA(Asn)/glutamyl-tRNA(Gln) amidotransferase subunit B
MEKKFEMVIGLEVHAHLMTESKMFCGCSTRFGAEPNTQVCPICLGMPGVLPVPNIKAVELAVRTALAVHCTANERSIFARKNYFYPDLPKGYQISQFEEPLSEHGWIDIESEDGIRRRIRIRRIHLEEDAGKSIHDESFVGMNESLIDLNRCGVPLIEIVTEPDIRSPREAYLILVKIRQILRWLGICDGNMEEGSLRCDANISLRPVGSESLGTKTELKNMNSFRGVEKALEAEAERQTRLLENGDSVIQETLLWDEKENAVIVMREKEESHDYRYFPDPDLVPLIVNQSRADAILSSLPEMPEERKQRWIDEHKLPEYNASILTEDIQIAEYFEELANETGDYKQASNWVMGEVLRVLKENRWDIDHLPVRPKQLAEIIRMVKKGMISNTAGKKVFDEVILSGGSPIQVIESLGLGQISDEEKTKEIVDQVIRENPVEVEKWISGKDRVFGFLIGRVMKAAKGKANPEQVNHLLKKKLEYLRSISCD